MLKNYSKIEIDKFGNKYFYIEEDKEHRLDGSAVEWSDGSKFWVINGNTHRNIDSASEYTNGLKYWWFKGERHRIGGPFYSFCEVWRIHGKDYTKKEYFNIVWDI